MIYEKQGLYVDPAHLEAYAENLARAWKPQGERGGKADAVMLGRSLRELDRQHDALRRRWSDSAAMPGAVRWILDNHYLARREAQGAVSALRNMHHLRCSGDGSVLMLLCRSFLRCGHYELNEPRLLRFLSGVQRALILERSELDGLRAGLAAALIDGLTEIYRAPEEEGAAQNAGHCFDALRYLGSTDLLPLIDAVDTTEQMLLQDPAGIYPSMAKRSRREYRRELAGLAQKMHLPEYVAARHVLSLAKGKQGLQAHIGYWLYTQPLGEETAARRGGWYLSLNVLLTLFFSLLLGFSLHSAFAAIGLLLPISELIKRAADGVALRCVRPAHVPRMALSGGVPDEGRTLCVISALLSDEHSGPALAQRLEQARLVSRDAGANLRFAILADLPDTAEEVLPDAAHWIAAAKDAVDRLNEKYGGGFYLLTRKRKRTPDGRWAGWERKRGALLEAMRFLRGGESGIAVTAGDAGALHGTRFLLTLDSDTRLAPGAALGLIGTMLHPMNRPVIDTAQGIVRSGYGILAPRIGTELAAAGATDFSRAFAGQGGTDPYGGESSELYMDLFRRGGFAGKGLIDIDAYLLCMGTRVPEYRMLSHDAVEGAFLRTGFVSDIELSDGFPGSVCAYLRREERWTRGDWQNLPFLFRRGRALPGLERWRLFDSLRRSLLPAAALAVITAGSVLSGQSAALAGLIALLALSAELLQIGTETLLMPDTDGGERYHSTLLVGFGGAWVRTLLRLILLPAEAFTCLSAIMRALWRMVFSHRHLLDWETAQQSERKSGRLSAVFASLLPASGFGLLLMLIAPTVLGHACGVVWLLSPLCAWLLSLPAEKPAVLSAQETELLQDYARDTYRYFDEFLSADDHFLPPDNYQAQPPLGIAHRTSPTNIGFSLLSVLGALDLGLIGRKDAFHKIAECLKTLDGLEKWHGHLYNWYDTRTLLPLTPRYVSTVDSGNLCASLITLQAGLSEYGETALAAKAAELAEAMDFAPLFDRQKNLLTVGWDTDADAPTPSWYDLMASEARLTAYLAVARGDVPRELWCALSRAQLQLGRYRGLASWTGTTFEYLMPELLLPAERNSMLWETARFCLYAQQKRTAASGLPWGCSESAYASLDPSMIYRYKAHGVAALALKRGMDDELVIAPYSSFLALGIRQKSAIRNLKALEARGARGAYGFWDAVDYTAERVGTEGCTVRCVMAHHQGMSFLAALNALRGGILQRRFLASPEMSAFRGLLQERVIIGGCVLRKKEERELRGKPLRAGGILWEKRGEGTDFLRPECCMLSSEAYSLFCTETGLVRPLWGAISPYVPGSSALDREKGIDFFLCRGKQGRSLLPEPYGRAPEAAHWRFSTQSVRIETEADGIRSGCTVYVAAEEIGEVREIELSAADGINADAELRLRFRPLLARYIDYVNHPAFLGLGISAKAKNGALLLRRIARGKTPELWLCLMPTAPCSYELAPGAAYGRAAQAEPASESERFLTDPLVTAICPIRLVPGEAVTVRFALALAYREDDALQSARRMLQSSAAADLPCSAAAVLGMTPEKLGAAFSLLPSLCFPTAPLGAARQSELWRFGISGDLPILSADYPSGDTLPRARELMDAHLFLCGCGADFDLVFLSRDGASYHKPLHSALTEALRRAGGELLRDRPGGVHIIEDAEAAQCIRNAAALHLNLCTPLSVIPRQTDYRAALPTRCYPLPLQNATRYEFTITKEFIFYVNNSLPPRAWQDLLTNGRTGFLATDCGTGHLWYLNSRENPVSMWLCQPHSTEGPERLLLSCGNASHSLFADPEDGICRILFGFGCASWDRRFGNAAVRTTAFVPPDIDARVFLIECSGIPDDARLHWLLPLQLSPAQSDARFCRTAQSGRFLIADNPRSISGARPFLAGVSPQMEGFTCNYADALAWNYQGVTVHDGSPVFAITLAPAAISVIVCGCDAPEKLAALLDPEYARAALERTRSFWQNTLGTLTLRTPFSALDHYMNGWAAYQSYACRMLGRCSIYQSGGAFGFRDQLQDAVNLILFDSSLARAQILNACTRQYEEGDVQHWWHEGDGAGKGIRTRCSDDLLWLPWAAAEYVLRTGDTQLLQEKTPFLSSQPLADSERDRYETPAVSAQSETVCEHCLRALRRVAERGCGAHGLLHIGSGDWNDGFDAVGGESVWLSWFFLHVARLFSSLRPLSSADASDLAEFSDALRNRLSDAWDGAWFLRGYYADGTPLGSAENPECRIDSIAQSWAVLSGFTERARGDMALTSALHSLYDPAHRMIKLFDPPFSGRESPGYIRSYGPGFRENGGQYTHAALWLVSALQKADRTDEAWELLSAMLPADREIEAYRGEPFVLAADVYAAPGHEGEAGWTWYTGSAGWFFRIAAEEFLGLKLRRGILYIEPKLPQAWPGYTAVFRGIRIQVQDGEITVDGKPYPPQGIRL